MPVNRVQDSKTSSSVTLEYGLTPPPGRVTVVDHADGSVEVVIPRRPGWQPVLVLAVGAVLFVLVPMYLAWRTRQPTLFILPLVLTGTVTVLGSLMARWATEEFRFRAGRDFLRVWYRDSGDDVFLEVPREQVLDVHEPGLTSGDKNHLIIVTAGGTKFVQMFRSRGDIRKVAEALRRGLGRVR